MCEKVKLTKKSHLIAGFLCIRCDLLFQMQYDILISSPSPSLSSVSAVCLVKRRYGNKNVTGSLKIKVQSKLILLRIGESSSFVISLCPGFLTGAPGAFFTTFLVCVVIAVCGGVWWSVVCEEN